jgi:hypothetical protein
MKPKDLEAIFQALNEAGSRYVIEGGLAVVLHGYGRMTADVDLVVDLNPENSLNTLRALESIGYRPRIPVTSVQFSDSEVREGWILEKGMTVLNLYSDQHPQTSIDVFVAEPFDFDSVYQKAEVQYLDNGTGLRYVDLATLLNMKQEAGRDKGLIDIEQLHMIRCLEEG